MFFKDSKLEFDWRVWTVNLLLLKNKILNKLKVKYFKLSWIDETSIVPNFALELLHVDAQACLYHQSDHENEIARANFDKSG